MHVTRALVRRGKSGRCHWRRWRSHVALRVIQHMAVPAFACRMKRGRCIQRFTSHAVVVGLVACASICIACHVVARTMAATGGGIGHLRSTAGANDDGQHLHRIRHYNGNWRSAPRPHYIEAANLPIGSNGAAYWEASRMGRRLRLLRIKGFAWTPSIKTRQALTRQQTLHRCPRSARDPRGRSFSARGYARASARECRRSSPAPHT
ncbi:hypothetical protein AK36_6067 [Burkholderia vietnamiensis LMG 10929]|nr:hypothetical protein AK36_6067 [Burkholderia vietnamiensis LMG 10929]